MATPRAAMTFTDIAKAMNTTKQNVFHAYTSAMRKLRSRPEALDNLVDLQQELDYYRAQRQTGGL
jgi:DNA-directed RNA polymerase sigma subunit (sigma70/sigma32)